MFFQEFFYMIKNQYGDIKIHKKYFFEINQIECKQNLWFKSKKKYF